MKGVLVGLGGRGFSWIKVCERHPEVELVGFVDPVDEQRTRASSELGIDGSQLFKSLNEAVEASSPDFALDITPPRAHEEVALKSFAAGLHVLQEKPLSDDFSAAVRIVDSSKEHGRIHMVTQNYRFGPVPRTTRRLLSEGAIGAPEQVAVGFPKTWATKPGTHYTTMPYPLITDMGVHHFDMLRYVLDSEAEVARCVSWNPSWGWHAGDASHVLHFQFEGGLSVIHHSFGSSVGRQAPWNGDWHIDGPDGSITWQEDEIFVTRFHPPEEQKRDLIQLDDVGPGGQDAIMNEFVQAVSEGREPECSGSDNLKSLAMVFAAVTSAREERPVPISEILH